jgi:hypothetical protein
MGRVRVAAIFLDNVSGWFCREARGVFGLTTAGRASVQSLS